MFKKIVIIDYKLSESNAEICLFLYETFSKIKCWIKLNESIKMVFTVVSGGK